MSFVVNSLNLFIIDVIMKAVFKRNVVFNFWSYVNLVPQSAQGIRPERKILINLLGYIFMPFLLFLTLFELFGLSIASFFYVPYYVLFKKKERK
jgi:hypothetical protein